MPRTIDPEFSAVAERRLRDGAVVRRPGPGAVGRSPPLAARTVGSVAP